MRCEDEARMRSKHPGKTSCLLAPDKLVLVSVSCDFCSTFFSSKSSILCCYQERVLHGDRCFVGRVANLPIITMMDAYDVGSGSSWWLF